MTSRSLAGRSCQSHPLCSLLPADLTMPRCSGVSDGLVGDELRKRQLSVPSVRGIWVGRGKSWALFEVQDQTCRLPAWAPEKAAQAQDVGIGDRSYGDRHVRRGLMHG